MLIIQMQINYNDPIELVEVFRFEDESVAGV